MSFRVIEPQAAPAVPADVFGRCYESARRSWRFLGAELRVQLAALFDPSTLKTLAIVVALWVGSQLTIVGPFADVALLVYGGYGLVKDLVVAASDFGAWYAGARDAKTEADLDAAAAHFARGLAIVGADVILTILSAKAFQTLKAKIKGDPKRWGAERPAGERPAGEGKPAERPAGEGKPAERPAGERPAGEGKPAERPAGERPAGEGKPAERPARPPSPLVAGLVVAGATRTSSELQSPWLLIGVVGGLAVVTVIGVALTRKS
jgi:hypothetical protein